MRTFTRLAAPLVIAAAALSATAAQRPAPPRPHHSVAFVLRNCPEGTNWDNAVNACV